MCATIKIVCNFGNDISGLNCKVQQIDECVSRFTNGGKKNVFDLIFPCDGGWQL